MLFRLLSPHALQRKIGNRVESAFVEKGAVISDTDYVSFAPTPAMVGLDPPATEAVRAVCDAARQSAELGFTGQFSSAMDVPGYGNGRLLEGGDLHGLPPGDPQ